jgi:TonB-linked SusC/RagA family outer membrane protein
MKKTLLLMMTLLFASIGIATAQTLSVSGTVVSESDGQPVVGAYVLVNGTTLGTITNDKGEFGIKDVPANAKEIIVTFLGLTTASVPVQAEPIKVVMKEDFNYLNETIVVAFGTSTKESFTGSATVISSDAIAKVQSSDATRALEGRVAGVQMTTSTGTLGGSTPTIRIRGFTSINAGNDPLYIVDGVPYSGDINNINPADIESMTVLKDAASNALYGARGANGVIMITTKKAKAGEAVVTVDAKWGINSKALQEYDVITDPAQYYEAHYLALRNYYTDAQGLSAAEAHIKANSVVAGSPKDGGLGYQVFTVPEGQSFIGTNGKVNPAATLGRMVAGPDGKNYWVTPDNWLDETYRQAVRQEYNVSVSGKSGNGSYLASFGYLNNKGIVDGNDMYRYTARLKADYQAKKWLKMGANFGYTNFNWNNGNSNEGSGGSTANVFAFASAIAPIYPVYVRDEQKNILVDGRGYKIHDYGDGINAGLPRPYLQGANPLQEIVLNKSNSEGNALNVTGFAEVKLYDGLNFTFNVGTGLDETRSTSTKNPFYGQFAETGGLVSKSHSRTQYVNLQQLLTYEKTFADVHHVSALVGHESYMSYNYSLSATRSKMFSIDNSELSGAVVDGESSSSSKSMYNNEGYLGRFQYDYANRIFFNASYRRDASSRFHPDNRWGNFWSLGGAWLINEESWFNAPWVNMLKIKASYGSQGNDNIGNYRYTDTYSVENLDGQIATTFVSKGNKDITWETNANFNTGLEYNLWANRVSGSVEYFYRKTSDMLFFFNVATSSGYSGYYDNIGDMRNAGVEFDLNVNIFNRKNFTWDVYANATHYTNKVIRLPEKNKRQNHEGYQGYENGNKFIAEGLPLNTFFMPKYAGVDRNTGEPMWYKDIKDDKGNVAGQETTKVYDDATDYICADTTPLFYGGFGTSLSFYGFDVSANFTYSVGGRTYDSGYAGYMSNPTSGGGDNYHKDIFKAWTPENRDTDIPRWNYMDLYSASASDRFLVPASYLNLQNAQVGYTLPAKLTQKFNVKKLRLYVACDNVVYWSYRKGLDPRYSFSGSTNTAVNSPIRTVSGGINITF